MYIRNFITRLGVENTQTQAKKKNTRSKSKLFQNATTTGLAWISNAISFGKLVKGIAEFTHEFTARCNFLFQSRVVRREDITLF